MNSSRMALQVSRLLSQYGILSLITEYLTTRELLYLAITCKEHWAYIHGSPVILQKLKKSTCCEAQAHDRKKWEKTFRIKLPDPINPDCKGSRTRACVRCDMQVCQVRF